MKKILFLCLLLSFFSLQIFAQIDDIKKNDKKNKDEKTTDLTEEVTVFDAPSGACVDACARTVFDLVFQVAARALINHHQYIMQKIADPMKLSFEVNPTIAYGFHLNEENVKTYDYFNALPQFRARWGVLATDIRYNLLVDYQNYSLDAFKTFECLMLFNIQPFIEHRFSFGTGISWDPYSLSLYNEHIASYNYLNNSMKYKAFIETRLATDYTFPTPIFYSELNIGAGIKVLEVGHVFGYANLGFSQQNYLMNHKIWLINAGFTFNVH